MQDTQEIWKDIPGYNSFYQASNFGRIRRCDSIVNHPKGGKSQKKGRIIKQFFHKQTGYMRISLCLNGNKITCSAHVMIAKSFVPNPNNLPQANHKDGNKINNHANNFEWVTSSENRIHAINNGFIKTINPEKLLTRSKINTLLTLNAIGYNQIDLQRIFKLSQSTISRAINGKRRYGIVLTKWN